VEQLPLRLRPMVLLPLLLLRQPLLLLLSQPRQQ
jgi:hypothetical protein